MTPNESCESAVRVPPAGAVEVEWDHDPGADKVDRALFVFTELATGTQISHEFAGRVPTCIHLLPGTYRATVFARGLKTLRQTFEVAAGAVVPLKPVLSPDSAAPKLFQDVLERFGIDRTVRTRDLVVPNKTTVVLDTNDDRFSTDRLDVEVRDVETAKRMFGHPDALWPDSYPRYAGAPTTNRRSPETIAREAAREYVYGNSASVKAWTKYINDTVFDEVWKFPLFIFDTVTVNAGGVLVIGDKSNFLVCRRLRMHVTATLLIRGSGPILVEPLAYETFC